MESTSVRSDIRVQRIGIEQPWSFLGSCLLCANSRQTRPFLLSSVPRAQHAPTCSDHRPPPATTVGMEDGRWNRNVGGKRFLYKLKVNRQRVANYVVQYSETPGSSNTTATASTLVVSNSIPARRHLVHCLPSDNTHCFISRMGKKTNLSW